MTNAGLGDYKWVQETNIPENCRNIFQSILGR